MTEFDPRAQIDALKDMIHSLGVTVARIDERTSESGKQMLSLRTDLANNYVSTLELTPIKASIAKLEAELKAEKESRIGWQTWALRAFLVGAASMILAGLRVKGAL